MPLVSTHLKTAISTSSSVPQTLDSIPQIIGPAYDSTRTARVASFDPYPTSQASGATTKQSKAPAPPKPPANKGVLPAINPPVEIAMPCGFEMWSNGGWTPKKKVRPVVHYVKWALADAYTELKRELCDKFCGKVELVTKPNEDREIFTADHFPYCHSGNRKGGSVEDNKGFGNFSRREKTIDLIFDQDVFAREDLDQQEEEACTNQARSYALRSGIMPQDTNTHASPDSDISIVSSLPSAGAITESAIAASTITGESTTSKSQIESHTTKGKIPTPENIPRARTTRSTNAEGAIPPMDLTNLLGEDQLAFVKITPPCKQSFYFMFPRRLLAHQKVCAEQGARRPSLIPRISLGTDLGRWTTPFGFEEWTNQAGSQAWLTDGTDLGHWTTPFGFEEWTTQAGSQAGLTEFDTS
ncbi:hypothetical protein H4Q26_007142 [Puccinia striiformis f. sp. tritici PST-130]|nr:hypothetical protein H4Q26_007142 [Puccinia striiformis f. sp. tritici PST-130]